MATQNTTIEPTIKTRFVARFEGVTLGSFDTEAEAERAIEDARDECYVEE